MNCPKCGAKCESDQSFCVVCGAPLYSNGDNGVEKIVRKPLRIFMCGVHFTF